MECHAQIAILLASYQGEAYIAELLDSLLGQSMQDWTVYAHDDGSKDKTAEILSRYAQRYPDHVCIVPGPSTGGARNNFFYLLKQVHAPYYMFCDQDDIWLENKIEKTFAAMQTLGSEKDVPHLVHTDLKVVDSSLQVISDSMNHYQGLRCEDTPLQRLLIQNAVTGCTVMINRALRDQMLSYRRLDQIIMHDWWAALVAARFGTLYYLPEPTILYRQHEKNSVGAKKMLSISYLCSRLNKSAEILQSLEATRNQAKEFAQAFSLDQDSLVTRYGNLAKQRKLSRLKFYGQNKVAKAGILRNLGLLIWG